MSANFFVDTPASLKLPGSSRRKRQLDTLIDWYDKHKPGQVTEIAVGVQRSTVMAWGIKPKLRGGPLVYRDKFLKIKPKPE